MLDMLLDRHIIPEFVLFRRLISLHHNNIFPLDAVCGFCFIIQLSQGGIGYFFVEFGKLLA